MGCKGAAGQVAIPVDLFVTRELEFIGSYGMQAARYPEMLRMVESGKITPGKLVSGTVPIEKATEILASMTDYQTGGVTVIDQC
jgi:D-arabinose 1-dehydrogenase-like Zn-dependent alcohol dehydrogenase